MLSSAIMQEMMTCESHNTCPPIDRAPICSAVTNLVKFAAAWIIAQSGDATADRIYVRHDFTKENLQTGKGPLYRQMPVNRS